MDWAYDKYPHKISIEYYDHFVKKVTVKYGTYHIYLTATSNSYSTTIHAFYNTNQRVIAKKFASVTLNYPCFTFEEVCWPDEKEIIKIFKNRPTNNNRDYQRKKLYSWENNFFRNKPVVNEKISSVSEICNYIDYFWIKYNFRFAKPNVHISAKKKNGAHCAYNGLTFSLDSTWTHAKWVIIHELAHWIQRYMFTNSSSHGEEFAGIYSAIIDDEFGIGMYDEMKKELKVKKIDLKGI